MASINANTAKKVVNTVKGKVSTEVRALATYCEEISKGATQLGSYFTSDAPRIGINPSEFRHHLNTIANALGRIKNIADIAARGLDNPHDDITSATSTLQSSVNSLGTYFNQNLYRYFSSSRASAYASIISKMKNDCARVVSAAKTVALTHSAIYGGESDMPYLQHDLNALKNVGIKVKNKATDIWDAAKEQKERERQSKINANNKTVEMALIHLQSGARQLDSLQHTLEKENNPASHAFLSYILFAKQKLVYAHSTIKSLSTTHAPQTLVNESKTAANDALSRLNRIIIVDDQKTQSSINSIKQAITSAINDMNKINVTLYDEANGVRHSSFTTRDYIEHALRDRELTSMTMDEIRDYLDL